MTSHRDKERKAVDIYVENVGYQCEQRASMVLPKVTCNKYFVFMVTDLSFSAL